VPQVLIAITVALYGGLALLLLSLNIASLWKWWVKGAAIVVTAGCVAATYLTVTAMLGWPSDARLPAKFHVVAARVIEPDRAVGAAGRIYLWVEEVDAQMLPSSAPRSYQLPYTRTLADRADAAQKRIAAGDEMLGTATQVEDSRDLRDENRQQGDEGVETGANVGFGAGPTGSKDAASTKSDGPNITFREMPPMHLPAKANGRADH
jgi:hypothetical protein